MRPIRLPELPIGSFEGGVHSAIRRAVVIGNGFAGAENQCFGLVRALGFSNRLSFYRVTRPSGGINEWLHWLPISLHKKLDRAISRICGDSRLPITVRGKNMKLLPDEKNGLSDILDGDPKQIATMACETFEKDGPLLVVASGSDTISVASSIKRLAPENVFLIQIQHPRSHLSRFDMVITPRHDYYPLSPEGQKQIPWFLRRWITPREPPERHVVLTVGALHQVDSTVLRSAAYRWHDELAPRAKPLLVVNVGGPTRHCQYGADLAKQLTVLLQDVLWSCGSVQISFSRRTPRKVSDVLVREFGSNPKVYIWNGEGKVWKMSSMWDNIKFCLDPNPHMGHLAWADAFVITADSVSMLSEACSTGKPVYVIGAERCTWKFADFQNSLRKRGVVRLFTGKENIAESWSYTPLNDTAEAAGRVVETLAERGWRLQPS